MRRILLAAVVLLSACDDPKPAAPATPPPPPPAAPASAKATAPAAATLDLSTPEKAAQAFLDACTRKDLETVKKVFSDNSEKEFKSLRDGTAPADMLEQLWKEFGGGSVTAAKMGAEEKTCTVDVKLPNHARREEHFEMAKEGAVWKILGF